MNNDEPYLDLIAKSINQVFEYLNEIDKENFLNNNLVQDACLSKLIVIGEYSIKVSEETKEKFTDVEWRQMKIARNFYVHAYGQINWSLIWETIQNYLPLLQSKIENILSVIRKEKN